MIRNHLFDVFQLFDYADASVTNGNRTTSAVAPQALYLLNGDLMRGAMRALAARVALEGGQRPQDRIAFLYMVTLARKPHAAEVRRGVDFLRSFRLAAGQGDPTAEGAAWEALCQVLLASNEFLHIR